jgi:predicted TIM-barrel fold metal-dependent hydrolase
MLIIDTLVHMEGDMPYVLVEDCSDSDPETHPTLYLDLHAEGSHDLHPEGSHDLHPEGSHIGMTRVACRYGAARVLFGSDSRTHRPYSRHAVVESALLSKVEKARVLWGTAATSFGVAV